MENSIFARFARAFFIFWHFEDVLVLPTTWNDLFCSCIDNVSIWWQIFNFVFLCPKRWFQFNSMIVRTHFLSIMTLNNWKNDCRNAMLHFQMTFSLPSKSCLLKLPKSAYGLKQTVNVRLQGIFRCDFSVVTPNSSWTYDLSNCTVINPSRITGTVTSHTSKKLASFKIKTKSLSKATELDSFWVPFMYICPIFP